MQSEVHANGIEATAHAATSRTEVKTGSVIDRVLDHTLYPLLVVLACTLAWLAFQLHLTSPFQATCGYLSFAFLVLIIERLRPFEPAWNKNDGQLYNDLALALTPSFLFFLLPILDWYANGMVWLVSQFPALHVLQIWPKDLAAPIAVVLAILLYDLCAHTAHRLNHTFPFLWRFHSVHHGAARLIGVNVGRNHPMDTVTETVISVPIVILLGVPAWTASAYLVVAFFLGPLQHCNIRMRSGFANYLLNTPEMHRWHHSPVQRETDTNYGQLSSIWDRLFGTFYLPQRRPRRNVGLDFPMSASFVDQVIQPFTPAGHKPKRAVIPHLPAGEAGVSMD